MTDVLVVDYDVLDGSRRALDAIAAELGRTDQHRDELAAAVGNRRLADAVREFADNWDRHRGELLENLRTMSSTLAQAADAFRSTDQQAGQALGTRTAATTSAGTATPGPASGATPGPAPGPAPAAPVRPTSGPVRL